ncbi:MAG: nicotinate phosphoribosyltransferase, partial [Cyanobacteria bacterium P01_D01_bin.1]
EDEAFAAFHRYFPGAPLLIDTYDTVSAAERLAQKATDSSSLKGVRIDSGNLAEVSKQVRSHLPDTPIFASGDLDEHAIAALRAADACIDGYGLGTKLVTGTPVNGVYKLVEIDGIPVMKESSGKLTYPGRKQLFRRYDEAGKIVGDRLALSIESAQGNEIPLLHRVMHDGIQITEPDSLDAIAQRTTKTVQSLPDSIRRLQDPDPLPIELSQGLESLTQSTRKQSA